MTYNPKIPEPPPQGVGETDMQKLVLEDLQRRRLFGIEKYGTPLQAHDGRDALRDLYDELLDACVYIRKLMYERDGN